MWRYSATAKSPLRRAYATRTARQLEWVERRLLEQGFGHIVCSERERQKLLGIVPRARVAVIDNGVDTAYFAEVAAPRKHQNSIVFVGSMDYHPNIDAAVSIRPQRLAEGSRPFAGMPP